MRWNRENKEVHRGQTEAPVGKQSSIVVMLRALVMMACLIAIPLVALFGTSLPDVIKAVKEGRWPTLTGMAHALLPTHTPNPNQDQNRPQNALDEPAKFEPAGDPLPTGTAAMLARPANVNTLGAGRAAHKCGRTDRSAAHGPALVRRIDAAADIGRGSGRI